MSARGRPGPARRGEPDLHRAGTQSGPSAGSGPRLGPAGGGGARGCRDGRVRGRQSWGAGPGTAALLDILRAGSGEGDLVVFRLLFLKNALQKIPIVAEKRISNTAIDRDES